MITLFENFNDEFLIHVTSKEKAEDIKINGFLPNKTINFKYYSDFYSSKQLKYGDKVCLIHCKAPKNILQRNNKKEDGIFVSTDKLDKVESLRYEYKKPVDIY